MEQRNWFPKSAAWIRQHTRKCPVSNLEFSFDQLDAHFGSLCRLLRFARTRSESGFATSPTRKKSAIGTPRTRANRETVWSVELCWPVSTPVRQVRFSFAFSAKACCEKPRYRRSMRTASPKCFLISSSERERGGCCFGSRDPYLGVKFVTSAHARLPRQCGKTV